MKYTVIIEEGPTSYGAYIPDLPGCVAVGDTREEVIGLISEGVVYHLELMAEHGEVIPKPTYTAVEVQVEAPTLDATQQSAVKTPKALDLSDFSHPNDEHDWIGTRRVLVGLDCYKERCKTGPTWACRRCFNCSCNRHQRKVGCAGAEGSNATQVRDIIRQVNETDLIQKFGVE